ncbi:hypothetical protein Bpfe_007465 [Biomphalaria pfeifferi]|uniref:Uncharacterized protein n=1 Tax=Biomphalaria pfeifferi TaxID=112525 RepID=A0AAD8BYL1_BIOPF|nr:hypothetical protein Bpfe_007465 [Biomphalaria pfeifferi]
MCFDTTVSNTGRHTGACHLIEKRLLKDLLHLPCRHHILEIVVEKAFTAMKIEASSGLDIAIFKRFRDFWQDIDQTNFDTASDEVSIPSFKERVIRPLLSHSDDIFGISVSCWSVLPFLMSELDWKRGERWCRTWTEFLELRHHQHKRYRDCDEKRPLSSFVTISTRKFFQILQLPDSYLTQNVETWKENDHYQEALRIVQGLKVVNDCAKRGVKLIQEYNSILTNDEQQTQYLLQLVQQHRHVFSDSKKTTVVSGLTGQPKLM